MAIKNYAEMRKIDVLPLCELREAKDDKGRTIKVPYLCIVLNCHPSLPPYQSPESG